METLRRYVGLPSLAARGHTDAEALACAPPPPAVAAAMATVAAINAAPSAVYVPRAAGCAKTGREVAAAHGSTRSKTSPSPVALSYRSPPVLHLMRIGAGRRHTVDGESHELATPKMTRPASAHVARPPPTERPSSGRVRPQLYHQRPASAR